MFANDALPGSAPYISRMSFGSVERSTMPGALICIRIAISYELMRVAISGSPTVSSRKRLRRLMARSESCCTEASTPSGLER